MLWTYPFHSGTSTVDHLPHCIHKTEFVFNLKLQIPHGSTLSLDKPFFVMSPLNITLVFPRLNFKFLLSKASFHFKDLLLSISIVSPSGLCHRHTATHLAHVYPIQLQHLPQLQKEKHRSLVRLHFNLKLL